MKIGRFSFLLFVALAMICCGRARDSGHHAGATASHFVPPTPDTTPIEILRTPAGRLLKPQEATPYPSRVPTPAASGTVGS